LNSESSESDNFYTFYTAHGGGTHITGYPCCGGLTLLGLVVIT